METGVFDTGFLVEFLAGSFVDQAPITRRQKVHMAKVYTTMSYCGLVVLASVYLTGRWVTRAMPWLMLLSVISFFYAVFPRRQTVDESGPTLSVLDPELRRLAAMTIFALSFGVVFMTKVKEMVNINPESVVTALMASIGIFGCFSLSALYMDIVVDVLFRGSLLFIIFTLAVSHVFHLIWRRPFPYMARFIISLSFLILAIVDDTKYILKRVEKGEEDYIYDALTMAMRFLRLFMKLAKLMFHKRSNGSGRSSNRRPKYDPKKDDL